VPCRALTAYVALAAADTMLAAGDLRDLRRLTKPALMPVLMLTDGGRDRRTRRALALCGAGDVALLGRGPRAFTLGLACFLGGHVAWFHALTGREGRRLLRRRPTLALPYVLAWAGLNAYLWTRTGHDRVPVLAYSTVLLAMTLTALDSGEPAAMTGGALFLVSDSLLALERFGDLRLPAHDGWVMATYTAAQGLLSARGTA